MAPRPPVEKPEFTIGTLRRAIPAHCFRRSALRSGAYLAADLVGLALLYAASTLIDSPALGVPRALAYGLLWPAYWFAAGAVATGVWVIAHECGHGAFSDSSVINDAVGFVLHSALLVPYFSWCETHSVGCRAPSSALAGAKAVNVLSKLICGVAMPLALAPRLKRLHSPAPTLTLSRTSPSHVWPCPVTMTAGSTATVVTTVTLAASPRTR